MHLEVADGSREVVLFFSARSWSGVEERLRTDLDDLLEVTDLLGETRTAWASAPSAGRGQLPAALGAVLDTLRRDGRRVRAAVVVLGDLSVLTRVDPGRAPGATPGLSSRAITESQVSELLTECAQRVAAADADCVAATAPLGRQAEVEVSELLAVAAWLRTAAGHTLDLAAGCAPRADHGLFANRLDTLNLWGAAELVRVVHASLLDADGPLPARDAGEQAARAQQRALHALAFGTPEELEASLPAALAAQAGGARHASRKAALISATAGLDAAAGLWAAVEFEPGREFPGLNLGRQLAGLPPEAQIPREDVETALLLLTTPRQSAEHFDDIARLAQGTLTGYPHRLESWIGLRLAHEHLPRDLHATTLRHLSLFEGTAVPVTRAEELLANWPAALAALPALIAAQRPFAGLPPDSPLLGPLRRRADLGYEEHALRNLERGTAGLHLPPAWAELRESWLARNAHRAAGAAQEAPGEN